MRKTFEDRLDECFENSIDVDETIWYSKFETLRDAIYRNYKEHLHEMFGDI